jgi:16S rRNA (cytosine967-C5)-methyltransferase
VNVSAGAAPAPLPPPLFALAARAAAEVLARGAHASDVLQRAFRSERLPDAARGRVAAAVHDLLRFDRRLEAILAALPAARGRGAGRLAGRARSEAKLLLFELRAGVEPVALAQALGARLGGAPPLDAILGDDAGLGGLTGLERDAVRLSWPTDLLARLVADHGEREALALADALNRPAPLAIRANTLRGTREALAHRLAEEGVPSRPTALARDGLVLEPRGDVFRLRAFREGRFEVMDEGSQLVAEAVAPPPRGRVLDACAGAGGKTLALGAALRGRGRILALDVSAPRLAALRRRARRAGLSNVAAAVVTGDGTLPSAATAVAWDRVLVDAPCSGLGTLRRNPELRWRLDSAALSRLPEQQLALLCAHAPRVAPGGRLVYATCTLLRAENEDVVARFLAEAPEFALMPAKEILGRERATRIGDGSVLRLLPHVHGTDGFFAAVLRRRDERASSAQRARDPLAQPRAALRDDSGHGQQAHHHARGKLEIEEVAGLDEHVVAPQQLQRPVLVAPHRGQAQDRGPAGLDR